MDNYPRDKVFRELFAYDNSEFTKFLEKADFFVARDSFSNYPFTLPSLSSMMNMQYNGMDHYPNEHKNYLRLYNIAIMGVNEVFKIFKQNGYKIVYFLPGYYSEYSAVDDHMIDETMKIGWTPDDMLTLLKNKTIFNNSPVLLPARYLFPKDVINYLHNNKHSNIMPPRYFKIHFMQVHDLVTGPHDEGLSNQRFLNRKILDSFKVSSPQDMRKNPTKLSQKFIGSVKYMTPQFQELIEYIVKNDPNSIILVHGDHGSGRLFRKRQDHVSDDKMYELLDKETALHIYGNFLALKLPQSNHDKSLYISDNTTLVNVFRGIFAFLSNKEPSYLPNKLYYVLGEHSKPVNDNLWKEDYNNKGEKNE